LYASSDPNTAVSELRPHKGEYASVLAYDLLPEVRLVDFGAPRTKISPFATPHGIHSNFKGLSDLLAQIVLLQVFDEELARPIRRADQLRKYAPTQYLCEYLKSSGFDGIVFRSAMGHGSNLALFHPAKAEEKPPVVQFHVERADIECRSGGREEFPPPPRD
jgi:hypothetical protein